MQTLAAQVATTFLGDAAALVNAFGRIVTHIVMAPIERIANACDVAIRLYVLPTSIGWVIPQS